MCLNMWKKSESGKINTPLYIELKTQDVALFTEKLIDFSFPSLSASFNKIEDESCYVIRSRDNSGNLSIYCTFVCVSETTFPQNASIFETLKSLIASTVCANIIFTQYLNNYWVKDK